MEIVESDSDPEEIAIVQDPSFEVPSTSTNKFQANSFSNSQVSIPETNLINDSTAQFNQFNQLNPYQLSQFSQINSNQLNTFSQVNLNQDDQLVQLACKFGEWFYSNLRELSFNPNDFYSDSQLGIQFVYSDKSMSFNEMGNQRIMEILRNFNLCDLRLKPNLLPQHGGIFVHLEQHGLLKIRVLGVLHYGREEDSPYGWFEDDFGLISDSTLDENNWRIKFYHSKLTLSRPLPSIDQFINSYKMLTNC